MALTPDAPPRHRAWLESLVGVPATDGNRVEILRNGDRIFPAMLDAIARAERTVDLVSFVFRASIAGEFAEALAERSAAGVRARVLIDAIGGGRRCREAVERMRCAGVSVELFRPVSNPRVWETFHRVHRKVLVCDETVGFTGGVGISDEWRGDARHTSEWRDTHFRIEGPAVDGLIGAFIDNWAETGGTVFDEGVDLFPERHPVGRSCLQVVREGARTGWGDVSTLVWALLRLARRRVRIATAYFAPDESMLELLCATARRGVTVELLVNGANADKWVSRLATEAQYQALLEAGVEVWSFQPSMLHLKQVTVDGSVAVVGSANFNCRSFLLDEEVNVVILDPDVVGALDADFDCDLDRSDSVDLHTWARRGIRQRALEAVPGFVARHL